jgi:hypothetical protein
MPRILPPLVPARRFHVLILSLLHFLCFSPVAAQSVSPDELRRAFSYAHEMDGVMSQRDFASMMRFSDLSARRNAVMTPVVRDMLDENVGWDLWLQRHSSSIDTLVSMGKQQIEAVGEINDPTLRRSLSRFADLTVATSNAYLGLRRAVRAGDEQGAERYWNEIALNGRLRVQLGMPIMDRLKVRLGSEFVDRHLDDMIRKMVRDTIPSR